MLPNRGQDTRGLSAKSVPRESTTLTMKPASRAKMLQPIFGEPIVPSATPLLIFLCSFCAPVTRARFPAGHIQVRSRVPFESRPPGFVPLATCSGSFVSVLSPIVEPCLWVSNMCERIVSLWEGNRKAAGAVMSPPAYSMRDLSPNRVSSPVHSGRGLA